MLEPSWHLTFLYHPFALSAGYFASGARPLLGLRPSVPIPKFLCTFYVCVECAAAEAFDGCEDVIGGFCPAERQWLAEAGVPAICIETRHAKAFLKAQVNKSDRNDARGIAQMMRVGLFRPVHVKTLASQKRRALLAARKILQEKALAIENDIRGLLRNFGLKVGIVGIVGFEQRIHDLVQGVPELADIMEPLLAARRVLREKFAKLHRKVLLLARDNEVCQRLMTIPGVGPVVSLAFISTVDVPARFRNSKAVGPSLGLTPVLNQSGESHRVGRISLCGDEAMRALLYEAAQVMLTRVQKWSWLKAWAMNIAKRRGQKKAIVALARRLAVIMHRMWSDGTEFRWTREMAPTI